MADLFNEEGEAVEALTKEEADAAVAKATDAAKTAAAEEAGSKIKDLEEQLQKAKDKEQNFEKLRTKTESKETEGEDLKKQIADLGAKVEEAKGAGLQAVLESVKDKAIRSLAGSDTELLKKIQGNYEILNVPVKDEDSVNDRVRRAYLLSVEAPAPVDRATGAFAPPAGSGKRVGEKSESAFSDELKGLASKFGVSDDDVKKFGGAKTSTK